MKRATQSIPSPSVEGNGQYKVDLGDAHEPEHVTEEDLDFDPAKLETPPPPADSGPDPFDVESLRLNPANTAAGSVKRALLTLPVRKPDRSWWVRAHPDPAYRVTTGVLEVRGQGNQGSEVYLIAGRLHGELAVEPCYRPCLLSLATNRQGDLFLWPVNLPREGDRKNEWSASALKAIDHAVKRWIRTAANMRTGSYVLWEATAKIPDPTWPEMTFTQLLKLAFAERFINSLDHPVLVELQKGA